MKTQLYLRVLLFLTLCVSSVHAQEEDVLRPKGRPISAQERSGYSWSNRPERLPFSLGLYGGLNMNSFSQTVSYGTPSVREPLEPALESGSGSSPFFGFLVDYAFSPNAALQLRLEYDSKSFEHSQSGSIDVTDEFNSIIQNMGAVTASYTAKVSYLNIEPTLRFNIDENFFLTFGLNYQMQMGDFLRNDKLSKTNPADTFWFRIDYNFTQGKFDVIERELKNVSSSITPDGNLTPQVPSIVSSRVGIVPGAGALIPLTRSLALAAEIRYQYMLTALNPDFQTLDITRTPSNISATPVTFTNPMLHSLQFSLGLWFKLQ